MSGIVGAAGVNGLDDLGVIDPFEIDTGDAEVAMAELTLDHDQRHAVASHLDGVRGQFAPPGELMLQPRLRAVAAT